MLWYKHHESLNQGIVLTFYSIVLCRTLFLHKLKAQIDKVPDAVIARHISKKAQAAEDNTYAYIMAAAELDTTDVNIQLKKKPGPNNPEEAEEFAKQINITVNKFVETIHSYEPYKIKDAYTDFATRYYDLLCEVEDYFKNASITRCVRHC